MNNSGAPQNPLPVTFEICILFGGFIIQQSKFLRGGSLLLQNGVITYNIYIHIYNSPKKIATEKYIKNEWKTDFISHLANVLIFHPILSTWFSGTIRIPRPQGLVLGAKDIDHRWELGWGPGRVPVTHGARRKKSGVAVFIWVVVSIFFYFQPHLGK